MLLDTYSFGFSHWYRARKNYPEKHQISEDTIVTFDNILISSMVLSDNLISAGQKISLQHQEALLLRHQSFRGTYDERREHHVVIVAQFDKRMAFQSSFCGYRCRKSRLSCLLPALFRSGPD